MLGADSWYYVTTRTSAHMDLMFSVATQVYKIKRSFIGQTCTQPQGMLGDVPVYLCLAVEHLILV